MLKVKEKRSVTLGRKCQLLAVYKRYTYSVNKCGIFESKMMEKDTLCNYQKKFGILD